MCQKATPSGTLVASSSWRFLKVCTCASGLVTASLQQQRVGMWLNLPFAFISKSRICVGTDGPVALDSICVQ